MFVDRVDAGRRLAKELRSLAHDDVVVFGLPRGGVEVAAEVAAALHAPLDVLVVRKVGVPSKPELAMGAVGEGGTHMIDMEMASYAGVSSAEIAALESAEFTMLAERVARLRHGRTPAKVKGRVAVIVDDGMATGATMRVACAIARNLGAARVVVAVPVAPPDTVRALTEADAVVCVSIPLRFVAVSAHYKDFPQRTEEQVIEILDEAEHRMHAFIAPAPA